MSALAGYWNTTVTSAAIAMLSKKLFENSDERTVTQLTEAYQKRHKTLTLWREARERFPNLTRDNWWEFGCLWGYVDPRDSLPSAAAVVHRSVVRSLYGDIPGTRDWGAFWLLVPGYYLPGWIGGFNVYDATVKPLQQIQNIKVTHPAHRLAVGQWWHSDPAKPLLWVGDRSEAIRASLSPQDYRKTMLCGPLGKRWSYRTLAPIASVRRLAVWTPRPSESSIHAVSRYDLSHTSGYPLCGSRKVRTWCTRTIKRADEAKRHSAKVSPTQGHVFLGNRCVAAVNGMTLIDGRIVAEFQLKVRTKLAYLGKIYYQGELTAADGRVSFIAKAAQLTRPSWLVRQVGRLRLKSRMTQAWTGTPAQARVLLRAAVETKKHYRPTTVSPQGWSQASGYSFDGFCVQSHGAIIIKPPLTNKPHTPPSQSRQNLLAGQFAKMTNEQLGPTIAMAVVHLSGLMRPAYGLVGKVWSVNRPAAKMWRSLGGQVTKNCTRSLQGHPEIFQAPRYITKKQKQQTAVSTRQSFVTLGYPAELQLPERVHLPNKSVEIVPLFLWWLGVKHLGSLPNANTLEQRILAAVELWGCEVMSRPGLGVCAAPHLTLAPPPSHNLLPTSQVPVQTPPML